MSQTFEKNRRQFYKINLILKKLNQSFELLQFELNYCIVIIWHKVLQREDMEEILDKYFL